MFEIAEFRVNKVYEEFHRIDIIVKGHFQRRVRKVWFEYKQHKEEQRLEKLRIEEERKKTKRGSKMTGVKQKSKRKVNNYEGKKGGAKLSMTSPKVTSGVTH